MPEFRNGLPHRNPAANAQVQLPARTLSRVRSGTVGTQEPSLTALVLQGCK